MTASEHSNGLGVLGLLRRNANTGQVIVSIVVALLLGAATVIAGLAAGAWQSATREEIKWSASAIEDVRFVYQDEAPNAFAIAESRNRATELEAYVANTGRPPDATGEDLDRVVTEARAARETMEQTSFALEGHNLLIDEVYHSRGRLRHPPPARCREGGRGRSDARGRPPRGRRPAERCSSSPCVDVRTHRDHLGARASDSTHGRPFTPASAGIRRSRSHAAAMARRASAALARLRIPHRVDPADTDAHRDYRDVRGRSEQRPTRAASRSPQRQGWRLATFRRASPRTRSWR